MRVLYQGKLDFFCAIYAVLNALCITHGHTLVQSRDRFAATLRKISAEPEAWDALLVNRSDFHWLVERMLAEVATEMSLTVTRPFLPASVEWSPKLMGQGLNRNLPSFHSRREHCPDRDKVWHVLDAAFSSARPDAPLAVIFRFHRFINMVRSPVISHWSTGAHLVNDTLILHDASKEEGAMHSLVKDEVAVHRSDVGARRPLLLEPESIFLLHR